MKPACLFTTLFCLLGTVCFAADAPSEAPRSIPVRLNDAPPTPPGLPAIAPVVTQTSPTPPPPAHAPFVGRISSGVSPAQPMTMPAPLGTNILAWDSESKDYNVKPGEMQAQFVFYFTNISTTNVVIANAVASCGCTVPKMPALPWTNAPGATGEIPVTMNLAGKSGTVWKTITVNTDRGQKLLNVKAIIPPPPAAPTAPAAQVAPAAPAAPLDRNKNQEMAKADRQAVFKGDCASCHVVPTVGKLGNDLYDKACGICHDAEHRATMVPDLHALKHATNADFWKTWTSQGKPGTLMPAFAVSEGGPLTDAQITSLVQYLTTAIPSQSVVPAAAK